MKVDHNLFFQNLTKRYGGVDLAALERVLCPVLIPIHSLDKTIIRITGQRHYRASFTIRIAEDCREIIQLGRTGKFVPKQYVGGGPWKEIAKGRILGIDEEQALATGEVYAAGPNNRLKRALSELSEDDYLEIDQYGAAAKVLSGLVESSLSRLASEQGYVVRRMPEDVAKHIGAYYHYDFEFQRGTVVKRVEVKSLWGTNTDYARLIRSKTKTNPTSSCRFDTQDIFAVSLFLRTGNIQDFAFARSVPEDIKPYGLPRAPKQPDHVNQNPPCEIGNGIWFDYIDEVWDLD